MAVLAWITAMAAVSLAYAAVFIINFGLFVGIIALTACVATCVLTMVMRYVTRERG